MKNPLSDIYTNKVLLNEEKDNVVVPSGKQEIVKGGKVPLSKQGGTEKVKGINTPEEDAKFSDRAKGKNEVKENMNTETNTKNAFEGAFERLFKSTLNEEALPGEELAPEVEIPTSDEDMANEITDEKDEVSDLKSDLEAVIDHLQSILAKIGGSEESEEAKEEEAGESEAGEEGEEEPFEESVDFEDEGHALVNAKSGKDLVGPKGKFEVKGAVKTAKGKAVSGDITNEPETKPLSANYKDLQNTKKQDVKTSNIKVGDFFK
jgi:hypothetical protein